MINGTRPDQIRRCKMTPRRKPLGAAGKSTIGRTIDLTHKIYRGPAIACCLLVLTPVCAIAKDEKHDFFEARIRPVLIEHCYECHNSIDATEGDFALDHRAPFLAGGNGGTVLVPGDPSTSSLMKILRHEIEGLEMPEGGQRLDESVIADFEKWIADGAVDPRDQPPAADEMQKVTSWEAIRERRKRWWSFQPITLPTVPTPPDSTVSAHPIDRFIDRRLHQEGLAPAPLAAAETLVRRLYFYLIGTPPNYAQLREWSEKIEGSSGLKRDAAVGDLVDHLLASNGFGERWARHWMDWVRYAESHGSEGDPAIDQAWQYRDYLIRAINQDVPLDQLVREHVAGDLLDNPRVDKQAGINESVIGPAHFRMVFHGFAPTDALDERVRFTDDQINAFSKAFLGLTVSCARCHDHKFDPISQADYYALFGIFASCRPGRTVLDLPEQDSDKLTRLLKLKERLRESLATRWRSELQRIDADIKRGVFNWDQFTSENHPLKSLWQLRQDASTDPSFPDAWKKLQAQIDARRLAWKSHQERDYVRRWDMSKPEDFSQWFFSGSGLPGSVTEAGDFRIFPTGENVLAELGPAGVAANLVSTKLAARLSSPDISLPENESQSLWVLARGGGGATIRYVVQDYPRNGTVYPVRDLTRQWQWYEFDLSYWAGDDIHVEVTAARDAPLLVKSQDRSWFEVRECVIATKGTARPPAPIHFSDAVLFAGANDAPESFEEATEDAVGQLRNLLDDWRRKTISDSQALMLDRLIDVGFWDNTLAEAEGEGESANGEVASLVREFRQIEETVRVPTRVPSLEESHGRNQALFVRGNHRQPSDAIPRRFLEVVDETPYETSLSGRSELAEDLLRDDNPLTRRVLANRIWHHLFGRGIVATPDNFGRVGDRPSHPELLDWLACNLEAEGWSIKKMIRSIVTSETWQRDVNGDPRAQQIDPENRLLSHANVRRLEAEAIRDSMLVVAGRLDKTVGGTPVRGNQPRRSVYVQVVRNSLDPFMRSFDFPEPFSTVGRRDVTNVPAQSLTLMNDPFVRGLARDFANRILGGDEISNDRQRMRMMMHEALQRSIGEPELDQAVNYLQQTRRQFEETRRRSEVLDQQLIELRETLSAIDDRVRKRLLDGHENQLSQDRQTLPVPIQAWDFDGDEALRLVGGAKLEGGALVVDGKSYALTEPIKQDLTAKTIEAVIQLDSLEQRGGGVITVQSSNGATFDAIVFAERDLAQWLAGSNSFARTKSFSGKQDTDADARPIHFAITYSADGNIAGYRNGEPYGKPYKTGGPHLFAAGDTVIGFGIRHLPEGGNRMLAGKILRAGLYDRALEREEVAAIATEAGPFISTKNIETEMTAAEREQAERLRLQIDGLQRERSELLGPNAESYSGQMSEEGVAWTEVAHALFTLKEFIYVR